MRACACVCKRRMKLKDKLNHIDIRRNDDNNFNIVEVRQEP